VPDGLMVAVVEQRLRGLSDVLLDGFPRTVDQARALDDLLGRDGRRVELVLALEAPEALLVDRLLERAAKQGRLDDTPEAIRERMLEYRERTLPVLEHYRRLGVRVEEIDAIGQVDEVFARVKQALQPFSGR